MRMRHLSGLSILVLSAVLAACGGAPIKPQSEEKLTLETLGRFIEQSNSMPAQERSRRYIEAAEFLIGQDDIARAHQLMDQVPTQTSDELLLRQHFALSQIALAEGRPYSARAYFYDPKINEALLAKLPSIGSRFLDLVATIEHDLAEYLQAFNLRVSRQQFVAEDAIEAQFNHDLLWESLTEIRPAELKTLADAETRPVHKGWLYLATLGQGNTTHYRMQIKQIRDWQNRWPGHPANAALPADIQLILQLVDQQAIRIAVLLPLSNTLSAAGQAIREGILAAYYAETGITDTSPSLHFYDTAGAEINALYDQAQAEGAQLVIGPLLKENVAQLARRKTLPLTTLALNTVPKQDLTVGLEEDLGAELGYDQPSNGQQIDNSEAINTDVSDLAANDLAVVDAEPTTALTESPAPNREHKTLYQFDFAIESEAEQVAETAWRDGHRKALIIAPSSTWGDRSVQSFSERWLSLGGTILSDYRFTDQRAYSKLIETAVAVDKSKRRKSRLQRLLGQRLEFEPRSRRDIDFIFMPSNSHQAKQLNPLLAFHYADDIPVYATSQVYAGKHTDNAEDLNGIKFATMPWYFDHEANEKQSIDKFKAGSSNLQSLYALGVDAYRIYPRLKQLRDISQAKFYGFTGKLSIWDDNVIRRQQNFAQIRNGAAIEIKDISALARKKQE